MRLQSWLDQEDARTVATVRRHGWAIEYVMGEPAEQRCSIAYTIDNWPHRVTLERVPNPAEILFAANRYAQRPDAASVPAYQLTYDDLGGRFPWEPGYANEEWIQPRPGTYRA